VTWPELTSEARGIEKKGKRDKTRKTKGKIKE
jgi:hypothetical protein